MTDPVSLPAPPPFSSSLKPSARAQAAAQGLEAAFLSEMLKSTGLGEQENSFSGGTGESQFASFQRDILAKAIVAKGGLGLAETFFNAMMERQDD